MVELSVAALSAAGGTAAVALSAWRWRRKPPGQWLAIAAVALILVVANAADWAVSGSGWSATRSVINVVVLVSAAAGYRAAQRHRTAERNLAAYDAPL